MTWIHVDALPQANANLLLVPESAYMLPCCQTISTLDTLNTEVGVVKKHPWCVPDPSAIPSVTIKSNATWYYELPDLNHMRHVVE